MTDNGSPSLGDSKIITITVINVVIPGDINADEIVDLKDFILAVQIVSDITPNQNVSAVADVNGDGKIGIEEAVYILQEISELR